jgi:phosphate transport system permease protein
MRNRKMKDALFYWTMLGSLAFILAVFSVILIVVFSKGFPALRWSLIFQLPKSGYYLGQDGGVANAILGTLYLSSGAVLVSIILALPAAIALQKDYTSPRFAQFTRLILDVLWGTPSIVYGAIGFAIMVYLGIRASLLGGIFALSLVMLPLMIRSMDEVIRIVPEELRETPLALGSTRFEMVRAVLLKQAFPGILTAVLLALGRGIGDAASVLFTAGFTDNLPGSLMDPVASLPLAVFFQIGSPLKEVQQRAYASAMILLFLILVINIVSRILEKRFTRHTIR